jgi:SPT2 chromatin protein
MSFLDVLDSIGTGQRPTAPHAQQKPSTASKSPHPLSKYTTAISTSSASRPTANGVSEAPNGAKRKFDNSSNEPLEKPSLPSPKQGSSSGPQDRKLLLNASSSAAVKNSPTRIGSRPPKASADKVYPKGSYAALMAEAKAAQTKRATSEVGLIKHQATSKVRMSKTERRKQEDVEKATKAKLGKQPQHNSRVEKRGRLDLKMKKRPESSYKGTAKPARPISSYKGTAGLPSKHRASSADSRQKGGKAPTKYDEYLGTDEEDEGDGSVVDDQYGSDASSDMEAGAFDVEQEESRALREAKADDAKEIALENKLKREKEERRRRLEALAKKRR